MIAINAAMSLMSLMIIYTYGMLHAITMPCKQILTRKGVAGVAGVTGVTGVTCARARTHARTH